MWIPHHEEGPVDDEEGRADEGQARRNGPGHVAARAARTHHGEVPEGQRHPGPRADGGGGCGSEPRRDQPIIRMEWSHPVKKIPSLYVRDPEDMAHVTREVHERCRWVIEEPEAARATVKWDGTCVMLDETGEWWARHQVKPGKATPPLYIPVEHDPVTGRTQGWIPMSES